MLGRSPCAQGPRQQARVICSPTSWQSRRVPTTMNAPPPHILTSLAPQKRPKSDGQHGIHVTTSPRIWIIQQEILGLSFFRETQIQGNCCRRWSVDGAVPPATTVTVTQGDRRRRRKATTPACQNSLIQSPPPRHRTLTVSAPPLPLMLSAIQTWSLSPWTITSLIF